jgi:predicted glycogen debranching enzyme
MLREIQNEKVWKMTIKLDAEICTDFEKATGREWLETNGLGGFAAGTVSGANSRRYHGLLTAATKPPLGRLTLLSKFEETLKIDTKTYELSANQYPNIIYPQGFKYLKSFRLDPFPIWHYEVDGVEIEKKIFMLHGSNTTVCQWTVGNGSGSFRHQLQIELRPLLSFADYHALQRENDSLELSYETKENLVVVKPNDDLPKLFFNHNAEKVEKTGFWYRNFEYSVEKERGFDFREDLFQPFVLKFDLKNPAIVIVSTEIEDISRASEFEISEICRRKNLIGLADVNDDFSKQLVLAADQFIVKRGEGKTIIAGYPWFSDWGRDTMIALTGLTVSTNRTEVTRQILLEFSKHLSQGMLPNRFPDADNEPEYNTVDATLWYFEAIRAFVEKTGDERFVRENLYQKLVEIIVWHVRGTRFQIHVDTDGLLYAGEKGVQLTWMDAKIGDWVVTPRHGKPVEIQALWYNALKIMANFAAKFGDVKDHFKYEAMAEKAKQSFNALFWNEEKKCLFDVILGDVRDDSVRPNQIFAVSLPHPILDDREKARKVVEKVEKELLTPFGLRSLSPKDVGYCPHYLGSPAERDAAYHQGTVWAWLIGGFIDAYRKVHSGEAETEKRIAEILRGFQNHLTEAGLGQISEIFDADAPHTPRGCFAQAWSVAEVLRAATK